MSKRRSTVANDEVTEANVATPVSAASLINVSLRGYLRMIPPPFRIDETILKTAPISQTRAWHWAVLNGDSGFKQLPDGAKGEPVEGTDQ
jgi:hypothetical protein